MDEQISSYVEIGTFEHRRQTKSIIIPDDIRDRHVYMVGKAGSGKSTLLFNMAIQDIERGQGVTVIDPHGDLVEDLLLHIPKHRVPDTIYFDAAERQQPISLNILNANTEEEVGLLVDDLMVMFKRLSDSWGERMEHILRHTFHTLAEVPGTTFLDIHRILQNEGFRQRILQHIKHRMLRDFWTQEFPDLRRDAVQPILNRMSKFMLSPTLGGVLGQRDSRLSFTDILENKKVLLVNLAKGKIGEDNSRLVGSLLVSQLQLAVMRRASQAKEKRIPYYLYIDEFQSFTTSAFEVIFSEARKYQLCLTLAHQYISQLDDRTRHAILGNVGTMILFAISGEDAHRLKDQLGPFTPEEVANLDPKTHQAICRPITGSQGTFRLKTMAPPARPAQNFTLEIVNQTKELYSSITLDTSTDEPEVETPPLPTPPVQPPTQPNNDKRPVASQPRQGTIKENILFYVSQAEYLSTQQIIALCFSHQASEGSRKANASAALKDLIAARQIKSQTFGRGNIYYIGKTPNVTSHNLKVRDIFVRIVRSEFQIKSVHFSFDGIPGLLPDLYVIFADGNGGEDGIHTAWEFDTGTEGIGELEKKIARYQDYPYHHLTFVAETPARLKTLRSRLVSPRTSFILLSSFTTLKEPIFVSNEATEPTHFFI